VLVSVVALPVVARAEDTPPQQQQQGQPDKKQNQQGTSGGEQQGSMPGATSAKLVTSSATIEKIDKTNGLVTLKDTQGRMFEVKPGPDIDMNKLHAQDRVTATYYEEVAVAIQKAPQGGPSMTEKRAVGTGAAERQATVTARIVSVQPKDNTVTIRTPKGYTHMLKVNDPALQGQLTQIKPGDNLEVTYTQAVAVSLQPRTSSK
jgi:hypothetical protein